MKFSHPLSERPDAGDLKFKSWVCENCDSENSNEDADCQYCEPAEIAPDPFDEVRAPVKLSEVVK